MTWPQERVSEILALSREGLNSWELARVSGVPRSTIRNWVAGHVPDPDPSRGCCFVCHSDMSAVSPILASAYAYLLGMYLGDGWISNHPRGVKRLQIALDRKYPVIIAECEAAMSLVVPRNKVLVSSSKTGRFEEVSAYSSHWTCLLPQNGTGPKHLRTI